MAFHTDGPDDLAAMDRGARFYGALGFGVVACQALALLVWLVV